MLDRTLVGDALGYRDPVSTSLSPDQRLLLQEVYDVFCVDGSWLLYGNLDAQLYSKHDVVIDDILAELPEGLVKLQQPPQEASPVMLRVAGLLYCDGGRSEAELFIRALRWCVARRAKFHPKSPTAWEQLSVASDEMRAESANNGLNLSEAELGRLRALFDSEWVGVSFNGSTGNWNLSIPKEVRKYRGVVTIEDYLRLVEAEQSARHAPHQMISDGPTLIAHPQQRTRAIEVATVTPRQQTHLALTVEALHPLIADACQPLFAGEHYRQGVLDAMLALRDIVRQRSGLTDFDDSTLMGKAFGHKDPKIVLADLTTETGRNIQRGTGFLAQGLIARVRNVLTHEKVELDPAEAMEMVGLVSRVARDIEAAPAPTTDDAS